MNCLRAVWSARRMVVIAAFAVVLLAGACTEDTGSGIPAMSSGAFTDLAIVPTLEFAGAPRVVLATAADFHELWEEAHVDRVFGRMDPETGIWIDFAFVLDGVFYAIPARGFHTPADLLDAEELQIPNAESYYQVQRRSIPAYRYRSYFLN